MLAPNWATRGEKYTFYEVDLHLEAGKEVRERGR